MMIGLYMYEMLHGPWIEMLKAVGEKTDVTRIPTQTISGIGFLGAGIIFKVAHYQVSGLTTATGLFAAVVIGIAVGAGFYVGVLAALILVMLVLHVMAPAKNVFKQHGLNITIYVEFESVDDVSAVSEVIESLGARLFEVDIERAEAVGDLKPSALFDARLSRENRSHFVMLSSVAELPCVSSVQEIMA
jgi:putative Mg2+ transporter-C (MgtC) family protein